MSRPPAYGGSAPAWVVWVTRISLVLGLVALAITVWIVGLEALLAHLAAIGPWFTLVLAVDRIARADVLSSMTGVHEQAGVPS